MKVRKWVVDKETTRIKLRKHIKEILDKIVPNCFMTADDTMNFPYTVLDVKESEDEVYIPFYLEAETWDSGDDTTKIENICDLIKEKLEDDKDPKNYAAMKYLFHFIQSMDSSKELKYILGYVAKETGFVKPLEFAFDEEEQFIFESIMYSAFVLYNSGGASKTKLAECHKRFINQIEQKMEDKLSRTLELNNIKVQALKELGYTEINENNASEVFEKIAEIQSRKVGN